ncbi:hypothetical protein QEH59_11290 [Coraliomargarita sp. SDUM461004]|uniref:Chromosome partition protein Smc n=1 Tax=Thalassobacterium sedimentorum TaxID=3041258 RepID=A0ABU1AJR3_9BACT|nr:hypothetical protein [Coraliomargarita sp. SDUM461004]MDQ8195013.1 hypothetical protein [Coraliomargarita sp. SDUM461004]
MNSLSMILRILAIVAALAAGALFYLGKGKLAEQQISLNEAEQATAAAQAELTTVNQQIGKLEGSLKSEREALAEEKRKLESIRSEMYTARQEVSRTQQQLNENKKAIQALEDTSKSLRAELLNSEKTLTATNKEGELAQLNQRIAELEKANAELKESLAKAEARVTEVTSQEVSSKAATISNSVSSVTESGSGYTSTFQPSPSQPLPTASLGAQTAIQSLSSKNGLIVLSNSPELGLSPGITVSVIKDMKDLGQIQVIQLSKDLVIANILPGAKTRQMAEGTIVSLLH